LTGRRKNLLNCQLKLPTMTCQLCLTNVSNGMVRFELAQEEHTFLSFLLEILARLVTCFSLENLLGAVKYLELWHQSGQQTKASLLVTL